MATFTVVGAETVDVAASGSTQVITVPLPAGTSTGDLLIVGHPGSTYTAGFDVTDSRFELVPAGSPFGQRVGAIGTASTLDDVEVTVAAGGFGVVTVLAVTDVVGVPYPSGAIQTTLTDLIYGPDPDPTESAGIAMVCDVSTSGSTAAAVGEPVDWTSESYAEFDDGSPVRRSALRFASYVGSPLQPLYLTYGAGTAQRAVLLVLFGEPAPAPLGLRVRQTIPPERVRATIPPERVRQVIP